MSENNYGALMMKTAVGISDDINSILLPGIYIIPAGNSSSPDSGGGVLNVYAGLPVRRTFTSDSKVFICSTYNSTTSSWSAWSRPLIKADIGNSANQIPDMSFFTTGYSENGSAWTNTKSAWEKGPNGVITQWGLFGFVVNQTGVNVSFPVPFPTRVESIVLTLADMQEAQLSPTTMPAYGVNSIGTSRTGFTGRMSGNGGFNLCYMAKGR